MRVVFHANGHPSIAGTHRSTIEITKESHLSPKGDCIVAVNSSIGPVELPEEAKRALSGSKTRVQMVLKVGKASFTVDGKGDPRLTLSHPSDFVIRKSGFVSERTLMVHANKAACDIPREMIRLLKEPSNKMSIEISISSVG